MHDVGFIIGFVVLDFWYVLGHFRFSDTGCVFGTTTDATLSLLCVECIQVSTQVSTSYLLASQLCPQLHGLSLTCHIAPSVSDVINTFSSLYTSSCGVPKAPFSVLCFSSCTLSPQYSHLLPFPERPFLCRRSTPNCFFSFYPPSSTQALPTCNMPFSKSLFG